MKNYFLTICFLFAGFVVFAQAGHIMQGVGAVNMSMGGAATAQPLDISGAIHWNPATLSNFDGKILDVNVGAFFSSPTLYSSVPTEAGPFSGVTEDDRGTSIMPAVAFVWGEADSKHTFGVSAFGISGFGVTFPQSMTNPINMPQPNGFGLIESDYMLMQVSFSYAYEVSDQFSIGIQPNFNYSALELAPNPIARPDFPVEMGGLGGYGYPNADAATAFGFGGQIGVFYDSGGLLKLGASYKTEQSFGDFDFDQKYLDPAAPPAENVKFTMNYPAIFSVGLGLTEGKFDLAVDYRYVDYENTEGFEASGWEIADNGFPTGAVKGFGWKSMSVVSIGLQYQATERLPIRLGYTYSSNPIDDNLAFFSIPATAVIENAMQIGFSYVINDKIDLSAVYHQGFRGDGASGRILNPSFITPENPLGVVANSSVAYDMSTSMIQVGFNYKFGGGSSDTVEPEE